MNLSSPEFLAKLKAKEHSAVSHLVELYHEILFKGAIKQGLAPDQAEVVVQNTWGSFFEGIERFEGRSHIRTYLFGIMYNKAKETFRDNKKYTADYDESALDNLFSENGQYKDPITPHKWLDNRETGTILQEEISKLPENQRAAFILKEIEGEPSSEICKILNISNTNLGVLIYRAKNNLRVALNNRFDK
jgi:RNA polymerase sigma-70 factor (ECF subfamily)